MNFKLTNAFKADEILPRVLVYYAGVWKLWRWRL